MIKFSVCESLNHIEFSLRNLKKNLLFLVEILVHNKGPAETVSVIRLTKLF